MNIEKLIPLLLEHNRTFTATSGGISTRPLLVKRPKWNDVYHGYPKDNPGRPNENDTPATKVFPELLGSNYDKTIFANACATRVSLGLLNGKMSVKTAFKITNKNHPFYNKGFQTSASGLKKWLSEKSVWGDADVFVKGKSTIKNVADKINEGRVKNGVYIILGGFGEGVSGHATLWIGRNRNVIGGHNYVDYGGDIYFWELK